MEKENGVVAVPKTYFFKMAKLDYKAWHHALPREFYQNSVDAGASLIEVTTKPDTRRITVSDNGCGMDYATIKEKLLVLGGSKKADGNVGAFGKAKEILFFSWQKYHIRTQDLLVTGEGANYTIERVNDWQDGTVCSIWIWDDEDFNEVELGFDYVARRFEVDSTIKLNGIPVETSLNRGVLIRSMKWANVYLNESVKSYYVGVRIEGQWMFHEWLSGAYDIGSITLEVHGNSIQCLTSNRDSLKGKYSNRFRKLMEEFIIETKSALEPDIVKIREKFTGAGRVVVNKAKAKEKIVEYVNNLTDSELLVKETVADAVIDSMPDASSVDMDRVEETAKRGSYWDHEDRFSFIGFQPDFHVVYEEGSDTDSKLKAILHRPNIIKLANSWVEILKQVMLDIECYSEFNVGFNFSSKECASYERVDGEHYFYLNPNLLLDDCEGSPKWYRSRRLLQEDLVLKGIHEITHLYCDSHNEDFIVKSEWIRARTWKSWRIYPKIMKECWTTI